MNFDPIIRPCWSGPPVIKTGMFSPWLSGGRIIRESNGKGENRDNITVWIGLFINTVDTSQEKAFSASLSSHAQPKQELNTHRLIIIIFQ